jgi:hypothetical protein
MLNVVMLSAMAPMCLHIPECLVYAHKGATKFSIMTLSLKGLFATKLCIESQHVESHYAGCNVSFTVMLSVVTPL